MNKKYIVLKLVCFLVLQCFLPFEIMANKPLVTILDTFNRVALSCRPNMVAQSRFVKGRYHSQLYNAPPLSLNRDQNNPTSHLRSSELNKTRCFKRLYSTLSSSPDGDHNTLTSLVVPSKLNEGDIVAVTTLSWGGAAAFPHRYNIGIKRLEDRFKLKVIPTPNALREPEWIHRNPRARADDLMSAFSNPRVKAIISNIGGDDSIRLLPYIDYSVIRKNPKIFLGYSDATVAHFMCLKAGIRSFYGPCVMTAFAENVGMHNYTTEGLKRTLFSSDVVGELPTNQEGWVAEHLKWGDRENEKLRRKLNPALPWKFIGGNKSATGRLIGGCVEVLPLINGTELWPKLNIWRNGILFLEISDEGPTPVILERNLRNMGAQGILNVINGILFSKPAHGKPDEFVNYDHAILKILSEYEATHIPVVTHMDFGHTDPIWTLPYGVLTEINPAEKTIKILENPVK